MVCICLMISLLTCTSSSISLHTSSSLDSLSSLSPLFSSYSPFSLPLPCPFKVQTIFLLRFKAPSERLIPFTLFMRLSYYKLLTMPYSIDTFKSKKLDYSCFILQIGVVRDLVEPEVHHLQTRQSSAQQLDVSHSQNVNLVRTERDLVDYLGFW